MVPLSGLHGLKPVRQWINLAWLISSLNNTVYKNSIIEPETHGKRNETVR